MLISKDWLVEGQPASKTVDAEWSDVRRPKIDGVSLREVRHVVTDNGFLTEIARSEWDAAASGIDQVFARHLEPQSISAWHCHAVTTDRLACIVGRILVVLWDGRAASPTRGAVAEYRFGVERPGTLMVPPGVWHGVKNLTATPSVLLNCVDHAYAYDGPDHWRLPHNTTDIPYSFQR